MRLTLFFLLLCATLLQGQTDYDIDQIALRASRKQAASVQSLANYFSQNIPDERGRARAIFAWTSLNVRYLDTSRGDEIWATPEHLERQKPEQVLHNRSAVCQGFANLFQALATATGLHCQVVTGIVKDDDQQIMRLGHAWVAVLINGQWALIDPTWAVPKPGETWQVSKQYFMASPEKFVLDHLPDDPVWQLLEHPVDEHTFRENGDLQLSKILEKASGPIFNYRDTLHQWLAMDADMQVFTAEHRILQFNGSNERIIFGLGQGYWGLFFDLLGDLDSLADRAILEDSFTLDTQSFIAKLALLDQFHGRARALFNLIKEPARLAQTEKFFSPQNVKNILEKLRGAMWTAVFENQFYQFRNDISDASLQQLSAASSAADGYYSKARQDIDCQKLKSTCYEIWHNQSLVHLQLGERYATFIRNLLAQKDALQYLPSIENAISKAQLLFVNAAEETRELMRIPPTYAFFSDRLISIQQGLVSLQVYTLQARLVALMPALESILEAKSINTHSAEQLAGSLQALLEVRSMISQELEDAYENLGAEYCAISLFNLQQEAFAMAFNLCSLQFKIALNMHQNARENNKAAIENQVEKALPWLTEAQQSLDYLKVSGLGSNTTMEQRAQEIHQLRKSINSFLGDL